MKRILHLVGTRESASQVTKMTVCSVNVAKATREFLAVSEKLKLERI